MAQVSETCRAVALISHALRQSANTSDHTSDRAWIGEADHAEAELLRRAGGLGRLAVPLMKVTPLRRWALASVDRRVPRTTRHLRWRKSWFHAHAHQFLSQPGQVVCLGSGLDPLGFRLSRACPRSHIVEADRAAVMRIKRRWHRATGHPYANLRHAVADFTDEDFQVRGLRARPDQRTLVLAEGLLMYLDPAHVEGLLAGLANWFTRPWQLAFTCLDPAALRRPESPIARLSRELRRRGRGERFAWTKEPDELSGWLANAGFALQRTEDSTGLIGIPYGEFVATASHPGR